MTENSNHNTTSTEDDTALDAFLQVADVRVEIALRNALNLDIGLAAIVDPAGRSTTQDQKIAGHDQQPELVDHAHASDYWPITAAGSIHSAARLLLRKPVSPPTALRGREDEPRLSEDEIKLLTEIASGVTADVAARKLELSARTLRRRLRTICDRIGVNPPIEAVVWAARRKLI